jgi:molybdopterin-guanine dinucleotide biosynthesis protein A
VILAGGRGTRLGGDEKAALKIRGRSLLELRIDALGGVCGEIILVVNRPGPAPPRVRVVQDLRPGLGPLMGLYSGLLASRTRLSFVTGVDMPFFRVDLFRGLLALAGEGPPGPDVTIPYVREQYEPLFAFYAGTCLPAIEKLLSEPGGGGKRIVSFFPRVRVRRVETAEITPYDAGMISFFNINTREDLRAARQEDPDPRGLCDVTE